MQAKDIIDEKEKDLAQGALLALSLIHKEPVELLLRSKGTEDRVLNIPEAVVEILEATLKELAEGNSVTLIPNHKLLTTQEAAEILNVSRPHLTSLLQGGKIPYVEIGTHKRVKASDLLRYKDYQARESEERMKELAALSQQLDMGY